MHKPKTFSISFTLSTITLLITGGIALLLFSEGIYFGKRFAMIAMDKQFIQISEKTSERINSLYLRPQDLITSISLNPVLQETVNTDQLHHPATRLFIQALKSNTNLYSIYVGDEQNNFFMVANIKNWPVKLKTVQPPDNTQWAAIYISAQNKQLRIWKFLDKDLNITATFSEQSDFQVSSRPWFSEAIDQTSIAKTKPYIYSSILEPGITYAKKIPAINGTAVNKIIGIDISLKTLIHFIKNQKVSDSSKAILFNQNGEILAAPDIEFDSLHKENKQETSRLPELINVYPEMESILSELAAQKGGSKIIDSHGKQIIIWVRPIESISRDKEFVAITAPLSEILYPYYQFGKTALLTALFSIIVFMLLAFFVSKRISKPIRELALETQKIKNLKFDQVRHIHSRITETSQLSDSFISMAHAIANYQNQLDNTGNKLKLLVDMGIALSAEKNENKLMEMILLTAKDLSNADGGTLYIREKSADNDVLTFEIIRNNSLNIALGGTTGKEIDLSPVPLKNPEDGKDNHNNVVSHSVLLEATVNITDAYADSQFDFSGTRKFDQDSGYHSKSFLTVPLKTRSGEVIGALQLINAQNKNGEVIAFSNTTQELVEALSAQAAVALDNRNLMQAQIKLFDSMIQLIARAIDAKSPYTGGHCLRVPEICMLLTEEVNKSNLEPFRDFQIQSEDEWRELSVSAWLHDCGKLTTPEYVVDKATKLETIYNRIHEIRTRFEVLRRDYEIEYLSGLLKNDSPETQLKQTYENKLMDLENDFQFIAQCNVGGEFMEADKIERIKKISETKWLRHFSDRIGISRDETKRIKHLPEPSLPVEESLLADRKEHIIPRTYGQELYGQDNPYGIKMDVPEHLYNYGEVYNLSIERGTLTREERFKINEHIIQTIAMLQDLPFPGQLARVAEYAGAHHETLIGTGYPRKLTIKEMSIPARIMAIADIFEALTAADRPYKPPKTISEAIRIMDFMRKDQHIDSDLFELFLKSGIYRHYADEYLTPDQIDEVDLSKYIQS